MNFVQAIGSLETGLIYGIVATGVWLTFRIINFADLTVDGSFALGAAVTSSMIAGGSDPVTASVCGALGGFLAGAFTGFLFLKAGIIEILTGILTMTGLYSVNLRIMGSPNIGLFGKDTLFFAGSLWGLNGKTWMLILISGLLVLLLSFLFKTNFGMSLRASGQNPRVSRSFGINTSGAKLFVIGLSNALVAFGGALFCQSEGFADSSMGGGTIIAGLAAVVIGESVFKNKSIFVRLLGCFAGSVIYRIAVSYALNASSFGLKSSDLSLISTVLVILAMQIPRYKKFKSKMVAFS